MTTSDSYFSVFFFDRLQVRKGIMDKKKHVNNGAGVYFDNSLVGSNLLFLCSHGPAAQFLRKGGVFVI